MREKNIEGKKIKIRALSRKGIDALREYGFSLSGFNMKAAEGDPAKMDEAVSKCIDFGVMPESLDAANELELKNLYVVFFDVIAETYGSLVEEKNLQSTSDGTPTKSE